MKTSKRGTFVGLALLACLAVPVLAEEYTFGDGGVEFDVPKGWEVEEASDADDEGDENRMEIGPASEAFHIWMWDHEEDDWEAVDEAITAVDAEIDQMLDDIHRNPDVKKFDINGMHAFSATGTGKFHDAPIEFEVAVVLAERPTIFITMADPAAFDEQDVRDFENFVKSIKPAEGEEEDED
jgi:hypothetical protein